MSTQSRRSLRVVIVEDYEDAAESLSGLMEDLGPYVVSTFRTAEAALAAWSDSSPDVALIDIGLSDAMDGCELARRVRQLEARTYLISMSGFNRPQDLERCRSAGFHEHLVKPMSIATIEGALKRADIFLGSVDG